MKASELEEMYNFVIKHNEMMKQADIPTMFAIGSIPYKDLASVEIRTTEKRGRGLFATDTIQKGDVIAVYPCDIVGYQCIKTNQTMIYARKKEFKWDINYTCEMGKKNNKRVIICADPNDEKDICLCAHLINDPYDNVERFTTTKDPIKLGKTCVDYMLRVTEKSNCVLIYKKKYCYAFATRDVQKNEELFAPYNFPYWVNISHEYTTNMFETFLKSLNPRQLKLVEKILVDFEEIINPNRLSSEW